MEEKQQLSKNQRCNEMNFPDFSIRHFTKDNINPYHGINFTERDVYIKDIDGSIIFEQKNCEFPDTWSDNACAIVASKYFKQIGEKKEHSIKQLISRVVYEISSTGLALKYFHHHEMVIFEAELMYLIINQMMSFNSPVWFNLGIEKNPQCSACFILNIEDNMDSILEWYKTEGLIFKGGSGAGINLSKLRSSYESMSTGGKSSGPVSFMRGADSIAGTIKSGGKTRRAAKMVILNVDHPDIEEFIECKAKEEKKAWILGEHGYDMGLNGEAWKSVQYQNANNSVRVSDEFMGAVIENKEYELHDRKINVTRKKFDNANIILDKIAQAAWECGDPGVQYHDTINKWHTTPSVGEIEASNPCSEYMHLNNSACNLASLNLIKFFKDGEICYTDFERAVAITIIAQDIIVSLSSYPTKEIEENAKKFRQLGIGFCNLGSLLMSEAIPYDSDKGRLIASSFASIMTGYGYVVSAWLAKRVGCNIENYEEILNVVRLHRNKHLKMFKNESVTNYFNRLINHLENNAYKAIRNSQISVIAPTGTISFMMDAETTGIEPELALVKYKTLVGSGVIKSVSESFKKGLRVLGYIDPEYTLITGNILNDGSFYAIKDEHKKVFETALGNNIVSIDGHLNMMAAVQPFISGAISKTINMHKSCKVEDVKLVFIKGWQLGLKSIAIYRDGSKKAQPIGTRKESENKKIFVSTELKPNTLEALAENFDREFTDEEKDKLRVTQQSEYEMKETAGADYPVLKTKRRKLPKTRKSVTHKFEIGGHKGYITVGLYEDGTPGEIFVSVSKDGSTISGLLDSFSIMASMALQYGVPLDVMIKKFSHVKFEPCGFTGNQDIPQAHSIIDYIFRWIDQEFSIDKNIPINWKIINDSIDSFNKIVENDIRIENSINEISENICTNCGSIMQRVGTCLSCNNCGQSTGCSG